jgi:hypothetical protein
MTTDNFLPPLHANFRYRIDHVGNEKRPVLVVDNFLHQAEALVGFAVKYGQFRPGVDFYPGIQSKVPEFYAAALATHLRDIISDCFNLSPEQIEYSQSIYSMVTTPPEQLSVPQARPHVDSIKSTKLAAVHYLCTPDKGGTSLYRHKATGFERLDETRMPLYSDFLAKEEQDPAWQKRYICGTNDYYEEIAYYEANFNRLIIYSGDVLHSASIAPNFNFTANPLTGRLTLTSFIHCK